MEDSASVTSEVSYFPHVRVFPNAQLVVDESVGGEYLSFVGVPL